MGTTISKKKKCIPKDKGETFCLFDCVFCNKICDNELILLNHIIICKNRMIHDGVIVSGYIGGNNDRLGDGTGDGGGSGSANGVDGGTDGILC